MPNTLLCKCGKEAAVYHLGSWVCITCGVEPWHCECGKNTIRTASRNKVGRKKDSD